MKNIIIPVKSNLSRDKFNDYVFEMVREIPAKYSEAKGVLMCCSVVGRDVKIEDIRKANIVYDTFKTYIILKESGVGEQCVQ